MANEILYLNNLKIELPENSIALTSQVNNLAELKDRQSNFSNEIEIPDTPANIVALQMLGIVGNGSRIPYINVSVKYIINGIETITDGKGILKAIEGEKYKLIIYDGNISIIDTLGNSKLSDLDFSSYNHDLTESIFFNSFNNSDGYIYALGRFYENADKEIIDLNLQSPAFYIHTLMKMIFEQKGFDISGDLLNNLDYLNRITSMDKGYIRSLNSTPSLVFTDNSNLNIFRDYGSIVTTDLFLLHTYTAVSVGTIIMNISGDLDITEGENYKLLIKKNGVSIDQFVLGNSNTTFNYSTSSQVSIGDILTVNIEATSTPLAGNASKQRIIFDVTNTLTDFLFEDSSNNINFNDLIGDTKQVDFVKDVMQHFAVIFRKIKNENEYEFKLMNNLLNEKSNAEDWSDKFKGEITENYSSNYAQTNILKYKYDENTEEDENETFADGEFLINDVNLPVEKILFTSLFKASEKTTFSSFFFNYYILKHWLLNNEDEIEPVSDGLRMFKIDFVNHDFDYRFDPSINGSINFSGTTPILTFLNADYSKEIELYYQGVSTMLNDYKFKILLIDLNVLDNYNLDFFRLKYIKQLGEYFYLNKVINFQKNVLTKVEVIRIESFTTIEAPEVSFIANLNGSSVMTAILTKSSSLDFVANLTGGSVMTAILTLVKAVPNLQQVTDAGFTTNNIIESREDSDTFINLNPNGTLQASNNSAFKTILQFITATAERIISFKNESGVVAFISDISDFISNSTDSYGASTKVSNMITLSQAEYDLIGSPDSGTMYIIV